MSVCVCVRFWMRALENRKSSCSCIGTGNVRTEHRAETGFPRACGQQQPLCRSAANHGERMRASTPEHARQRYPLKVNVDGQSETAEHLDPVAETTTTTKSFDS